VAPVTKPPPETVTDVPPAVDPEVGVIELIVGGGVGPPVFGKIVESFHTAPGAVFRYVVGDSTNRYSDKPSYR
jgi:hypothetical protein